MQSNIANIKTDGVFVTLPLDVQEELVSLCKMHGICPEWMSEGLNAKVELNQYEELRLLLRNNGEQDLPGLVAFVTGTNDVTATDLTWNEPDGELTEGEHPVAYEAEEFHSQPSSIRTRHKNN